MFRARFQTYLTIERNYSPHTLEAYVRDLDTLHAYLVAQEGIDVYEPGDVEKLTHRIIRNWMAQLVHEGMAPRSVARKISAVKTYLNFLQRSGYLPNNPAKRLHVPGFDKNLPHFLKEQEAEALFEQELYPATLEGVRDKCVLELLYGCGLRRSEIIALRREDVDMAARQLKVSGKGNKERIVPFGHHAYQALNAYLQEVQTAGISLEEAFFVRPSGEKLYPQLVYRIVKHYLSRVSDLAQRSPHVLRHTFATHLLDHGADLNAIKELLGHNSLAATQVYTHNSIRKLKSVHQQAHPRSDQSFQP